MGKKKIQIMKKKNELTQLHEVKSERAQAQVLAVWKEINIL